MFNPLLSISTALSVLIFFSSISKAALSSESPFSRASSIKLVVDPLRSDLRPSIESWEVTSYHVSPCYDYAVLQDPRLYNNSGGRTFYVNGTKSHPFYTNILSDGGTPPSPYGMIIPHQNDTDAFGRRPVRINCGPGTEGLGIARVAGGRDANPHLTDMSTSLSWFYACNTTLPFGRAIQLFFASHLFDEKTPAGCVVVDLLPQCIVNGTSHPSAQEVDCHRNVSHTLSS